MIQVSNCSDISKILDADKLPLGTWPTPLTDCNAFERLMIKRDDLSGFSRGGIKIRKLESFIGYYMKKKINRLVVVVPNLSNLRADMIALSQKFGLYIHFIVANTPALKSRTFHNTPAVSYTLAGGSMVNVGLHLLGHYLKLRLFQGKKAAIVLPSACHPSSIIGASRGLLELYTQCQDNNRLLPRHIFISASGGSSAAGLVLCSMILQQQELANIRIHVVGVYPVPMKPWIILLLVWTKWKYGLKVSVKPKSFTIWKTKRAYGACNETLDEHCRELKKKYGLSIDHIYGAPAWSAMEQFAKTQYRGDGLLFWHCGFTPDASVFKNGG